RRHRRRARQHSPCRPLARAAAGGVRGAAGGATDSLVSERGQRIRDDEKLHEGDMKPEGKLSHTPGARGLDAAVLGFAGFTVLCHGAVWLSLGLDDLLGWAGAALVLVVVVFFARRRRTPSRAEAAPQSTPGPADPERVPGGWALQLGLLGLAALGVGLHALTGSLMGYWGCAVLASVLALGRDLRGHPVEPQPGCTRGQRLFLAALCVLCAVAVASAHRGDADDAFYVNLAVWAVDHPDAPLLAGDTLHGLEGIPMSLPVFKLLSYELLQAGIARLTGVPALTVVHVWMPILMALLIPLAWARLAMLLLPRRWLLAVALVVAQLLFLGDGHASIGDFGLLRLQQGKSVLLLIVLPLAASYGLMFGSRPSRKRWLALAAVQIASLGLSTSGLWLAPATAFLAVCAALPLSEPMGKTAARALRIAGLALAACVYPLALAIIMRADTLRAFQQAVHPLPSLAWPGSRLMEQALAWTAGEGGVASLILFCAVAVLALPGSALFRRYTAIVCASFFLFFFDPLVARFVAHQVTGADTYFRVFWLVPLPLFVSAVLTAPLSSAAKRTAAGERGLRWATGIAATVLLVILPRTHTLSRANDVRLDWPGPKVPAEEFAAARRMAAAAGPGEFVLAPPQVARWIPLVQEHPAPVMVREMYLDRLHDRLGSDELEIRLVLSQMAGGTAHPDGRVEIFAEALTRYPLAAVGLSGNALAWPQLRKILLESHLQVSFRDGRYEIWTRSEGLQVPAP
ncbi:MAG: DUF6077 domain-containing protein, partial [Myxococcota bacterium]